METKVTTNTKPQHGAKLPVGGSVCMCEMPAKMKGKNQCWRCKKPFKEFLQDVGAMVVRTDDRNTTIGEPLEGFTIDEITEIINRMKEPDPSQKTKIVITVRGGMIQSVHANNAEYLIIDADLDEPNEGDNPDAGLYHMIGPLPAAPVICKGHVEGVILNKVKVDAIWEEVNKLNFSNLK